MPYTTVQHSAMGYKQNQQFARGLEVRSITAKEQARIEVVGGKVFATYKEADDYCDVECYSDDSPGLIPNAPGAFIKWGIDGLRLYIPQDD